MNWDIISGLITLLGALIALMNVVTRINRTLTSLEDAVRHLNETARGQSEKNRIFFDKLGDHEKRLSVLECDSDRKD